MLEGGTIKKVDTTLVNLFDFFSAHVTSLNYKANV